jgi:hypothetical protein
MNNASYFLAKDSVAKMGDLKAIKELHQNGTFFFQKENKSILFSFH